MFIPVYKTTPVSRDIEVFFLFHTHTFGFILLGIRFQISEVTGNQWRTL
jgi:hypothetical protein